MTHAQANRFRSKYNGVKLSWNKKNPYPNAPINPDEKKQTFGIVFTDVEYQLWMQARKSGDRAYRSERSEKNGLWLIW